MFRDASGYRRRPLPLARIEIEDAFWSPRQEQIRTRTLPQQEQMMRSYGHLDALTLDWKPGDPREPHIFWESDVAKWLEAASYCLAVRQDPELEASVDRVIDLLAGAQQPDGYLNVYFTVVRPGERFTDLRDAHELYCAGHLIEAGVAHHQATGRTSLLDIVRRYADLIDAEFSPGGSCEGGYCGHEEIELALVKLYRETGERRYLELSKRMIDARGTQPYYFDLEEQRRGDSGYFGRVFPQRDHQAEHFREYNQTHLPIREQTEIVGHSVRAVYLMSGVTDVAAEYDDPELRAAAERLWQDVITHKTYVIGSIGSDPAIEGFGAAYDLPNRHGYGETCASIGLVQWAQRLANLTGSGAYVDALERSLYNGVLSGASADGTHYFYGNPLTSDGDVTRHEWFGCACCPPNLARLISELGHYVYAQGEDEAVINLFVAGAARFDLGQTVTVRQETDYPRTGAVRITVSPEHQATTFVLSVRIPNWSTPSVLLNGAALDAEVDDGYLRIEREWRAGDVVELELDLAPRRIWAHPQIGNDAGKVAVARGPIVYCLEGVDHPVRVSSLVIPRQSKLREEWDEDASRVILRADGWAEQATAQDLYRSSPPELVPVELRAVPYASWANRGQSDMVVWIRETTVTD